MSEKSPIKNLYVHFPFCRRKCTYCALLSRCGQSNEQKRAYVARLAEALADLGTDGIAALRTIYFGGGSPALCDLKPLFDALKPALDPAGEFTVELHPLDVTPALLQTLKDGGVNRISMGVQSLDDGTLRDMGRGYTFVEAEQSFALIKRFFGNAGIDLILGYPSPSDDWPKTLSPRWARLAKWGLTHCSVYSLILEENSILGKQLKGRDPLKVLPSDEETLNRISVVSRFLKDIGLDRYEISNYARPGFECRHNLAIWRGEDYYGLGEGAHGRMGLCRTQNWWGQASGMETLTPEADQLERTIFRLRTREGLDVRNYPQWIPLLNDYAKTGLVKQIGNETCPVYRLTERGTEVCDSILADLV